MADKLKTQPVRNHKPQDEENAHIAEFDAFFDKVDGDDTSVSLELYRMRPELKIKPGRLGDRTFVEIGFKKNAGVGKKITWLNTPHTSEAFYFSVEQNGDLTRIIELSESGEEGEPSETVVSKLGVEQAVAFTDFITGEPWENPEAILPFCELDEDDASTVAGIHHKIMLKGMEAREAA